MAGRPAPPGPSALIAPPPRPHAERTPRGDRMMEVTASALDGQRFLHGLRADQLGALAETASEVTFPAGHRIFAEDGPVGSFWLIESGCVVLDVPVPGERPVIIGTV